MSIFTPGDAEGAAWLAEYIESARRDLGVIADMRAADLATPDLRRDLAARAHRLAGASFSVGAMLLGQAARNLEQGAPSRSPEMLRPYFDELPLQFADAVAAMAPMLINKEEQAKEAVLF
jgi:HPt (histidine-containing phosphotransfer) domain-containing protein